MVGDTPSGADSRLAAAGLQGVADFFGSNSCDGLVVSQNPARGRSCARHDGPLPGAVLRPTDAERRVPVTTEPLTPVPVGTDRDIGEHAMTADEKTLGEQTTAWQIGESGTELVLDGDGEGVTFR